MDNLFIAREREQLIQRVHKLTADTPRQWGKMNAAQMLTHLRLPLEVGMGRLELPSVFMMKIFGPMIRKIIFSDKPLKKNSPTAKNFVILDERHFETEKTNLLRALEDFAAMGNENKLQPAHKYFGKMSKDDWNFFQQRHFNHHLTQFGV